MTMGTAVDKAANATIVGIGRAANAVKQKVAEHKQSQWEPDEIWAAQFRHDDS